MFSSILVFSQSFGEYKIVEQRNSLENSEIPTFVKFSEDSRPSVNSLTDLFSEFWKGKSGFGFVEIGREVDNIGFTHIRLEQTYNGVGIEFAEWILHTKNNQIYSMNGILIDQIPTFNQESLSEEAALDAAKNYVGATTYKWEVAAEEAHLKLEQNNPSATYFPTGEKKYISTAIGVNPSELKLTYKFNIYAQAPLSRQEIYVDAANGSVVFTNNLIHTINTQGTANTAYSGQQTINTDSTAANSFRLRQTVSGNGINTFNLQNGTNYNNSVDFTDADNFWNNSNANLDQYATDAHWGAESTYDYFFSKFSRNSINNAGFALNSYIHYSSNFVNAFWDGQRMTYGDGNANFTPLVALDIAAHEITHGLTTFSANLVYADESGALNESFSDIFGAATEFHARPANANWLLGEDIGSALRSLSNPKSFGDPDTYDGSNWVTTALTGGCTPSNQNDQCGVHTNSGVQNFWFYLLSTGGTGSNDNGDAYNVTGLGIDTAAAIAYRNLTVYLTQSSNFADARFFSIQAATDLYGACSPQVISVTNAWHAVGVGSAYVPGVTADFSADITTSCAPPLDVTFTNLSNNGQTFIWDFGDGTVTGVTEPIKRYSAYGQYDVKLIADGGACGIDSITKTAYIDIDTANACVVILNNGTNATQLTCTGKIYDSGGANGNYSSDEDAIITISPPNAATITLTFPFFDVEAGANGTCGYDFLEVFDGSSINSPSLGVFCNNNIPTSITSNTGSVTIRFISDPGLEEAGFEIDWQCNGPTVAPVADFIVSSNSSCDGEIVFNDRSTQVPNSWFWDFGDGNTSALESPVHNYTTNGTFDVKLVVINSFGTDSITKSSLVTINRPAAPTSANDSACIGQTANLNATGNGTINWYDQEFNGTQVTTGNNAAIQNVTADSTLWAEDFLAGPIQSVGAPNNNIGTGANFNNNAQYLIFDVFSEVTLQSVVVYSSVSGNRTIELRDDQGVVLQSLTRFVSSGAFLVTLNFTLVPGADYQLGVSQGSTLDLYRNNGGTSYPYTIPGKISVKTSSAGTGFYYFFYDWKIKSPDCASPRVPVTAFVDTTCTVTSIANNDIESSEVAIFPNPAKKQFTIQLDANATVGNIVIRDLTGKVVYNNSEINSTIYNINSSDWSNGMYYIQFINNNSAVTRKVIISN